MSSRSTTRMLDVLCLASVLLVAGCASRANNDSFARGLRYDPRPPESISRKNSTPGDWTRVDRISRGTTLEVRRRDGTEVRGEFEGSDAAEIRLDTGAGSALGILKSDVQEVRAPGGHRLRNVLLAAGIGGAAGLLIWAAADGELVERSLVGLMIGGGGGAAGAALWPSSELLYEAPEELP